MKLTDTHIQRIANMKFSSVYPHYVEKVLKKGRTEEELIEVISWLTGFDEAQIHDQITRETTFKTFFEEAQLTPDAQKITGVICGYRVEEIPEPLTQKTRYLDKVIDELAKGWTIAKIKRMYK
jgi:hypothetical protein